MTYNINILEQAEQDIKDIYYYIAYNDSKEKAFTLIDELESTCFKLENFPERGIVPHELKEIGIIDYLQVICFSYRIIYQIEQQQVFIHAVLDGRRDKPSLLERRFLRRQDKTKLTSPPCFPSLFSTLPVYSNLKLSEVLSLMSTKNLSRK